MTMEAEEHDKRRKQDRLRGILKSWSLKARAQSFQRDVVDVNMKRSCLHTWLIRCHTVAVEHEGQPKTLKTSVMVPLTTV